MDVPAPHEGLYRFGPFLVNPAERLLTRDAVPIPLTHRVFETLLAFVRNPGRVLTKDELLETVWPDRFIDEGSLKQAIFALRKVLGGPDNPQYIVTSSGRGYSFAAPVQRIQADRATCSAPDAVVSSEAAFAADVSQPTTSEAGAEPSRRGWPVIVFGVVCAAITIAGLVVFMTDRGASRPKASVIVLADFQNLTNNQALGTMLAKVLEIDLAQSPFLILMPPQRVSETLRLMERPEDAKLTPALAQEVCARNNGDAVLSGTVARIGSRFLVTLEARDCTAGANITDAKADTARMEDIPNMLDELTVHLREGLNDSSASIPKFAVPIAQATTASFEALKAYSLGENLRARGDNANALVFFKRAIELDSSFALAYAELGSAYFGLREAELGKPYYKKAFDLRDRTGENEKLQISAVYYERVGNFTEAVRSYELWTQTYPQDWLAWAHLCNLYVGMARYPDSIAAGREALRLNPAHYGPYSVLARAYKRATRFADAKAIGRLAVAKGFDSWDMHGVLYEIAFAEGDAVTMATQVAKEKGKPTETWMLDYEAWGAATAGQLRRSRALFERAIEMARAQGPDSSEEAADFLEDYIEALSVLGLKQDARKLADTSTGVEDSEYAPFAFAMAGDFERAARLATALGNRHPDSTEIHDADIPLARAVIDLGQGKPNDAIAALQPALPYEMRDFYTPSFLAQAYLATKAPDKAAVEFRKILDNRGVDGLSPQYPLAYLGLARALRMEGKLQDSRAAYEKLFAFWKNADKDLPVLRDAAHEYAQLSIAPGLKSR
jgi:DNA-binding winged helix-turn-helix (wHTH) protein/tetratricopeptide (TPR) repeat protein